MAIYAQTILTLALLLCAARPVVCLNITEVDVLILGAGISGLTAGNHLKNNNLTDFLILEAQDYIGGRVRQFHIGNLTVGEGANWIHYVEEGIEDNPMLKIANEINLLKYRENEADFAVRNTNYSKEDFEKALHDFNEAWNKVVAANANKPRKIDEPLSSALLYNGWLPDNALKRTVDWNLDFEYAVKPAQISTNAFTGFPEENDLVTDKRGFHGIVEYLTQNISEKVRTEKVITKISHSHSSGGIEVTTRDGETYKAKYGLCTFSTGVLASDLVKFVPELPTWKRAAISRLPLAYYTNIFVQFPLAFWDDNNFIWNAGSRSSTFFALYNLNLAGIHRGSNILLFTVVDDNSLRIEAQNVNETKDEIMKTLGQMYPNVEIPEPLDIRVGQFSRDPYIRGSFSNANVGATLADFHNLQGRVSDLFFSGEATDEDYWGYTQGAYFTGLKQAKVILDCVKGKDCPTYIPELSDITCPQTSSTVPATRASDIENFSVFCLSLVFFCALFN